MPRVESAGRWRRRQGPFGISVTLNCPPPQTRTRPGPGGRRQAGLIETEPTSELVVISCGEVADLRTVMVEVPTNVWLLIL